ncbi:MAG: hypothetical protein GX892_04070 [Thermoanaerobacteraceae bacterium]|nr:hypothetical protein [Thermoanaerobacteraceae bacterium]
MRGKFSLKFLNVTNKITAIGQILLAAKAVDKMSKIINMIRKKGTH